MLDKNKKYLSPKQSGRKYVFKDQEKLFPFKEKSIEQNKHCFSPKPEEKVKIIKKNLLKRYRKSFNLHLSATLNPVFHLFHEKKKRNLILKINIRIKQNNVFCSLVKLSTNKQKKSIISTSAGKEKIHVSKKTLRFNSRNIILSFLKKIRGDIKEIEVLLVKIAAPLKLKILILRLFKRDYFTKKNIIFNLESKKCFNGCKAPKKRRKKRKGFRIFK